MAKHIKIEDIPFRDLAEGHNTDVNVLVAFESDIASLPIVEIVRCKDCMLNTVNTDGATENWCYKFGYAVEDTDFCSYGERK